MEQRGATSQRRGGARPQDHQGSAQSCSRAADGGHSGWRMKSVKGRAKGGAHLAGQPIERVTYCRVVNAVRVGVASHCRAQQTTQLAVLRSCINSRRAGPTRRERTRDRRLCARARRGEASHHGANMCVVERRARGELSTPAVATTPRSRAAVIYQGHGSGQSPEVRSCLHVLLLCECVTGWVAVTAPGVANRFGTCPALWSSTPAASESDWLPVRVGNEFTACRRRG